MKLITQFFFSFSESSYLIDLHTVQWFMTQAFFRSFVIYKFKTTHFNEFGHITTTLVYMQALKYHIVSIRPREIYNVE